MTSTAKNAVLAVAVILALTAAYWLGARSSTGQAPAVDPQPKTPRGRRRRRRLRSRQSIRRVTPDRPWS
jgi:hypothetical protein